jgi:hypothetical protein
VGTPLQPEVSAGPPNALGTFMSQQRGFTDKSHGNHVLFKIDSMVDYDAAQTALKNSPQFVRCGPMFAGMLGQDAQSRLVDFILLNRMDGAEQLMAGFNWIP